MLHVSARLLAGLSLLLASTLPAMAQGPVSNPSATSFGVKGGVSSTTLEFSGDSSAFDRVMGFSGGIYLDQPLFSVIGVTSEALFVRKGATDAVIDRRVTIDYLEVPILLRVGGPAWGGAYGFVGPAVNLRLRATFGDADVTDQYERTDLALVGGGGVAIGRFLVEGRVTWGRRNVAVGLIGMDEITNRSVSVMGGFKIW